MEARHEALRSDLEAGGAGDQARAAAGEPRGLRLGLVENTKFNASPILEKLAERLAQRHQMTVTVRNRKRSASHEVDGDGIKALRAQADLVISGIGD